MKILAQFKAMLLFGPLPKLGLLSVAFLALSGCGGGMTSGPINNEVAAPAFEEPSATEEEFSMLRAEGTTWRNEQNQKVSLRGINLGNWLLMEMWMFGNDQVFGSGVVDQCTFEDILVDRFGESEKDRIFRAHRDSWITEKDWDVMKDAGFNLVRIPFPYDLIEDDDNPKTLKSDAWHYLDWSIAQAKEREMYVVLDLHGAAGRQGKEHHSGCAGKNELWNSETYRDRTIWLWEQIAEKYKGEAVIAGYGLLNEPWGASPNIMSEFAVELYHAVRRHDDEHIVILPGHSEGGGITAYGDPVDLGMENVAFEMHFYPGIFGWGDIGYEVHRDWLTCGPEGDEGVCSWAKRLQDVYTPMLVGEMQPWTSLGELGGEITRATFDRYNELNWAATAWSLKTVSGTGGLGAGPWGLMTNKGDQLLVKGSTWACDDWESTFADACDVSARSTVPNSGDTSQTMYLVIKTGSFSGTDIVYDEIELTNDETGENIILNGDFGDATHWQTVSLWNNLPTLDFNYSAGDFAGSDSGSALRITAPAGGHNSAVYQAIEVEAGASYTISGKFKDLGGDGKEMWSEIYLVPNEPQQDVDVQGTVLNPINVNDSSMAEIEDFFTQFADMDYVINHWVVDALTREEPAQVFSNIPASPIGLSLQVTVDENTLTWSQADGQVDGYRVYRSTSPSTGFESITDLDATVTTYSDSYGSNGLDSESTYYYYISSFNSTDESYPSEVIATGSTFYNIPGKIEAENFVAAHPGVKTETVGDSLGGGLNIGHFETDRWVEYNVLIDQAGTYTVDLRLASLVGDVQFEIQIDRQVVGTVTVPNTGGWQDYQTVSIDVDLPAGEHVLRLHSLDNQWNLNWLEFRLAGSNSSDSEASDDSDENEADDNSSLSNVTSGTNADISIVSDTELDKDVIELEVLASDNIDQGYVGFPMEKDLTLASKLEFKVLDFQGSNTVYITVVDSAGATWSNWSDNATPSVQNQWTTIEFDYSAAANDIDLTQVAEVRFAQWNSGTYRFSDVALVLTSDNSSLSNVTSGTNADISIVSDTELGKDVIELEVLASDNIDQGYVGFPMEKDFTLASKLEFKVLDFQGSNTVYITVVDSAGATWSNWSDNATPSVQNQWTTIEFDYSAAANDIDLTQVAEVRFAQWNSGTYRFSDVALIVNSGTNANGSIVSDTELGKDVIELEVLASDNIDQGYVGFPMEKDFTLASKLEFKVLDFQGSNTVYITVVDSAGATWSNWSDNATPSVQNQWTTIEFDYSAAANDIDLTQVAEVRFAQWNSGTYRFSDITLLNTM